MYLKFYQIFLYLTFANIRGGKYGCPFVIHLAGAVRLFQILFLFISLSKISCLSFICLFLQSFKHQEMNRKLRFALLWCGVVKTPETLLMALGHLWQGFYLLLKHQNYVSIKSISMQAVCLQTGERVSTQTVLSATETVHT